MLLGGPSELSLHGLSASACPISEREGEGWRKGEGGREKKKEGSGGGRSRPQEGVREGGSEGVKR